MKISLQPGYEICHVDLDGHEGAWELWKGNSFLHSVVLKGKTIEDLLAKATLAKYVSITL